MKKNAKKLALNTETLVSLSTSTLRAAAGGGGVWPTGGCPTSDCAGDRAFTKKEQP